MGGGAAMPAAQVTDKSDRVGNRAGPRQPPSSVALSNDMPRASVARWGWSNSSRNFNSEVQNIPEEYFDLGNFKCKFVLAILFGVRSLSQ